KADAAEPIGSEGIIPLVPAGNLAAPVDVHRCDEPPHPFDRQNQTARLIVEIEITDLPAPIEPGGGRIERVKVVVLSIPSNDPPHRGIELAAGPSRPDQIVKVSRNRIVAGSRYQVFFSPSARHGSRVPQHTARVGSKGNVLSVGNVVGEVVTRPVDED